MKLSGPIELIKRSFKIFFEKKNTIYLLKIYSVSFVLSLCSFAFSYMTSNGESNPDELIQKFQSGDIPVILLLSLVGIIAFVVSIWSQVSAYEAIKRVVKGGTLEFKDTFKSSWKYLSKFFLVNFMIGLIVVLGLVLLVIPGIIFSVWYAFAAWILVDKNYGVMQSLRESKSLVRGRFWKVLGRLFVFILFGMLGQIVFSIVPGGYGSIPLALFGGLFILPNFLLYQELEAQ